MTPTPDEIEPSADPPPAVAPPPTPPPAPLVIAYEPPPPPPRARDLWQAGFRVLIGAWQAFLALLLGVLTVGLLGMSIESVWKGQWDGCSLATGSVMAVFAGIATAHLATSAYENFRPIPRAPRG